MIYLYNMSSDESVPPFAVLLGGQSNMVGASNNTDPLIAYQSTFNNVNWEGLPLNYSSNYFGARFGFDLAFGREFSLDQPNSTLYLEKEAVGGTNLNYWLTPTNLNRLKTAYSNLKTRVSGIPNIKIYFLWVQGESDANNSVDANAYESNFNTLVNELETAHGSFEKVVLNYLREIPHPLVPFEDVVRQQQIDWVTNNPSKGVGWDMTPYNFYDGVHYDNPSKYQMGLDILNIFKGLVLA